ncbi:hypothetical protein CASFOL_026411 [Castilleja foliolosa]|uniref:F-box associated beta-propeller type 1 domain-containing protein n=1 Tax=Castilleja foliolosa TaxID=1961234 RepID=A0ABD3CI19_9LAMI
MGPASKGMFFKVAQSISSKLRYNNKISNNYSSSFHSIPKILYDDQVGQKHVKVNMDKKLLLRRYETNEGSDVNYFSTLYTDNNGRSFSVKKNYCFTNHLHKHSYPSSIVGSCNGILCLVDNYEKGNTVLWNPATDELKSLPPSSIECPPDAAYTKFTTRGFGFDARSEDYKVLRHVTNGLVYDDDSYKATIVQSELYSLKNDSWRPLVNPVKHPWPWSEIMYSTSLNGSCYWYAYDCVLSFNFADEVFSCLPLPGPRPSEYLFCDIDGSTLGLIVFSGYAPERKRLDIWVWKSNEWCWSNVDSFMVEDVRSPLGLWGRDKCFLQGANGQLLFFDLVTRELKALDMEEFSGAESLVSFEESTVSISKVTELHTEARNKQSGSNEEGTSNNFTVDFMKSRTL